MKIAEAVGKGFSLSKKLINVIVIFFLFNTVIGLISLPLANPDKAGDPATVAMSIGASIIFFLIFIFLQGGALGIVKNTIKTGNVDINNFTSYGKKYYVRILGLLLMYMLIAIGVVLLLSLVSAGILLIGDNVATRSIVAVIVTIVAVMMITYLIYPIYSLVVDDLSPIMALKKGITTSKENFKTTLGLFVVMLVISLIISLIIGFLAGITTIPLGQEIGRIVLAVVNSAVQSYIPIVMMVAFMSFYMAFSVSTSVKNDGAQKSSVVSEEQASEE